MARRDVTRTLPARQTSTLDYKVTPVRDKSHQRKREIARRLRQQARLAA